jgi:hypothetical protein
MTRTYDTLRNALAIEMCEEIDVVEIFCTGNLFNLYSIIKGTKRPTLEQERAMNTSALSRIRLIDGCAVGSGVGGTVLVVENVLGRHSELDVIGNK